jgi:predicted ATPase/DNA-binding SARP family transcriptional activator
VEIRVLGAVEVVSGDGAPRAVALQQRRLLSALAIHMGTVRSSDVLIDALWGERPPAAAGKVLQVYVSRLRKQLPAFARIRTRGGGYSLEVEGDALDALRFERLLREGREAMEAGNPALALSLLRRALALWRGPAYGEFRSEEFARGEAERLEELRLVALEERIEAELTLGRHAELLPELRTLAAEHPWRERLQAQLMLALYRCRRQSEALDVYAGTRARLRNELGLEPGEELRKLQRRILQQDPALAPVRGPAVTVSELPSPPNRLLGRERELHELRDLLRREDVRLLVLTGAGGSGKTRLALEAAREAADTFANGTAFIDLAPLRDRELVMSAIAQGLGMRQLSEQPLETIAPALRRRELLLLLDNAEHLPAAAPRYVELLAHAPRLKLLVTSRVVLHLSGEHVYPVEPLRSEEAVALFCERARAADPRFQPDATEEEAIRRICTRLDNLPLAIELSASRIRTLAPHELLARLEPRLTLLAGGPRDLPARQQTLRATMDWSYQLLDDDTRRLLDGLSVFAGGFDLDAAAAVCLAGDAARTLELLEGLVESSLVMVEKRQGRSRYRLLETIRVYAAERLEAAGAAEKVRRRHAMHFLDVAQHARPDVVRFDWHRQREGLVLLDAERDNLHAAMRWTLERRDELALPLAAALRYYWLTRGYRRQGLHWLEAALALQTEAPAAVRAEALAGAALLGRLAGDLPLAGRFAEQAVRAGEEAGLPMAVVVGLNVMVTLAGREADLARARAISQEAVAAAREGGARRLEGLAWFTLAETELHAGNYARARAAGTRALEPLRAMEDHEGMAITLARLGLADALSGRDADAVAELREALEHVELLSFWETGAWCCEGLALLAARSGDPIGAARLVGTAETLLQAGGGVLQPAEEATRVATLSAIEGAAPGEELEAARAAGGRSTPEEAIARASSIAGSLVS